MKIEKQIRTGLPQVGNPPYGQVHAHSTGNPTSTAQNEADYHSRRDPVSGFFSHVVGNGRAIQTAYTNRGAWDVGGGWNSWGYAQVELIESHKTQAEFDRDYKLYVELLRQLAKEAGLPMTLDEGVEGIITHEYATKHQPNNKSDHVDPYPYLAKWGISRAQFKHDIEHGISGGNSSSGGLKPNPKPLKDGKKGDTVKVYNALYKDSYGAGKSTAKRGKQGKIKRTDGKSKKYLIEDWGWAHPNDIQLVKRAGSGSKPSSSKTKTVTIDKLNVYTSQSLSSPIVTTANGYRILKKGTKVKVTATANNGEKVHGSKNWSEVDGFGWVPSVYLK